MHVVLDLVSFLFVSVVSLATGQSFVCRTLLGIDFHARSSEPRRTALIGEEQRSDSG